MKKSMMGKSAGAIGRQTAAWGDVGGGETGGLGDAEEDERQWVTEVSDDGGRSGSGGDEEPVWVKPVSGGNGSSRDERRMGEGAEGGTMRKHTSYFLL